MVEFPFVFCSNSLCSEHVAYNIRHVDVAHFYLSSINDYIPFTLEWFSLTKNKLHLLQFTKWNV